MFAEMPCASVVIVRWVAENMRPFKIVEDPGFLCLMKTGRPDYYIPSARTVSRDVKEVFIRCRERIAKVLHVCELVDQLRVGQKVITYQKHNGALNFATDAWTSPNHKAYVAVTVHFQKDGVLVAMLLDLVEVAKSHSGVHLAAVFMKVLEDFMITDKVSV